MTVNQKLYPDELAERIKASGKKSYRPSNGTEGDAFMMRWCNLCRKSEDDYLGCEIAAKTMALDTDEPGYPSEWTYRDGQPWCTAFVVEEGK